MISSSQVKIVLLSPLQSVCLLILFPAFLYYLDPPVNISCWIL